MDKFIQESKKIYSLLGDDISKKIYNLRVLYTLTADDGVKEEIAGSSLKGLMLNELLLQKAKEYKLFLYGAGKRGEMLSKLFGGYWNGIIDSNVDKIGTEINSVKVYSIDELSDIYSEIFVVISVKYETDAIKNFLMLKGISEQNIIEFEKMYAEQLKGQYFDMEELPHCKEEVFIDCGAYDGQSAVLFSKWCENKYKHIYCFEPDKDNLELCKRTLKEQLVDTSYTIIPKGAWKEDDILFFSQTADVASHICDDSENSVQVTSIDKEFDEKRKEKVTFIKMDIEGAELEALKGAENTIKKYTPKLAISIYHKPEDIFTIPSYILSINSDYVFYIRHYTFGICDTILYAIPKGRRENDI